MSRTMTVINGYHLTLDTDQNGDGEGEAGAVGCWVEYGRYSSSLGVVEDFGGICDVEGNLVRPIAPAQIDKMVTWAQGLGW